jgi:ribosome biogenesis protein ENP2
MAMKVASFSGVKVYNLSSGSKVLPELLSRTKKRALAKDSEHSRRIELIQDLEMPTACGTITMTSDREHLILTGVYAPTIKCFTVSDLSLKFQRGLTSEVIATQTLSEDYSKLVFLHNDRSLSFHAAYGKHYDLRVPKFGRDLAYNPASCDLFVAASGAEVYRLNLEIGSFKEPVSLAYQGCNKLSVNSQYQLLACGGEDAMVEFWDMRAKKAVARIAVSSNSNIQVTALKFDTDGLTLAAGTSDGK